MDKLFEGKVALVTGAATGIGRATAIRFAEEGAAVSVVARNEPEATNVVREIEKIGGKAIFIRGDMTKPEDAEAMVKVTLQTFGRLDAAVNNVGMPGAFKTVVDLTLEEWEQINSLNLRGAWLSMKYEIPAMIASGGGAIVNVSSATIMKVPNHHAGYLATKTGMLGLTTSAAKDYGRQNIRVNTLLPGAVMTPMLVDGMKGLGLEIEEAGAMMPLGRVGRPEEQADAAIWLCSDRASYVTGIQLPVTGGLEI